jgi:hypothetical protein
VFVACPHLDDISVSTAGASPVQRLGQHHGRVSQWGSSVLDGGLIVSCVSHAKASANVSRPSTEWPGKNKWIHVGWRVCGTQANMDMESFGNWLNDLAISLSPCSMAMTQTGKGLHALSHNNRRRRCMLTGSRACSVDIECPPKGQDLGVCK